MGMTRDEVDILCRWRRRAVMAEQQLRAAGLSTVSDAFDNDEFLVMCLVHKNGLPATTQEITAARDRLEQAGRKMLL